MAMVYLQTLKALNIRVFGSRAYSQAKEMRSGKMEQISRGSLWKEKNREEVCLNGLMDVFTLEFLPKINFMAKDFSNGPMDESTRACGTRAKLMAKAHLAGPTVENTEGSIKMTRRKVSVCLNRRMEKNT